MGNIQVARIYDRYDSPTYNGRMVSFGAIGQAVKLHAIHYNIDFFHSGANAYLAMALSSNPTHELTPPGTQDLFFEDESLYGFGSFVHHQSFNGINWGQTGQWSTIVVPLYEIVRPRRQVFVSYWLHSLGDVRLRAEVYYEAVSLDRTSLDTLDRKYGKYRRT